MQICTECGVSFPEVTLNDGKRVDLRGRKRCLTCLPYRRLQHARAPVVRLVRAKQCASCGGLFAGRMVIEGRLRYLYRRRFCLSCSPFGIHNTSKAPPGSLAPHELVEYRRRKRNAKTYRSQKGRRVRRKRLLVAERGGRCMDCGYSACLATLEFHHRDRADKLFGLGQFGGSLDRLRTEAAKCDLLCANCHRSRHAAARPASRRAQEADVRRRLKQRAVDHMGGTCAGCGRHGDLALFEFHHRDSMNKDFGISEDGIIRRWSTIVAELAKCVMLCANCHREVHAGVRDLDEGLLGLAEDALPYVA